MTVEDEVRAVLAAWHEVLVTNDAAAIARYMTDDWAYVTADGPTPKAELIGWIAAGRLAHHAMTVVGPDRAVRAGDTVILTSRKQSTGTWDGQPYAADEWITEVYVRTAATTPAWHCAISHKTPATT